MLLDVFTILSIEPDLWLTCILRPDAVVVLHAEGRDRSTTLTAVLPRRLFEDFSSTDVRFRVHSPSFHRALLLLGVEALHDPRTRVTLEYSTRTERLLVSVADADADADGEEEEGEEGAGMGRSMRSEIQTRAVPSLLLDLRFDDALLEGEITLDGRTLRDVVADFTQAGCAEVAMELLATASPVPSIVCDILRLTGSGPDVELTETMRLAAEPHSGDARLKARTSVSASHLALVCGCRKGGGTGAGSADKVKLRINAIHQLCVLHTRELTSSAAVTISAVTMPKLTTFEDW